MARTFEDTALRTPEPAPLTADPAPLGLAGFGITTLLLSLINAGILNATVTEGVMALALAFGGGAQLLAGMWAFRRGNTFAATAFTSYGAFWFSFYLLVNVFIPQMKGATLTASHSIAPVVIMLVRTFRTSAAWQDPHVVSTTRRSTTSWPESSSTSLTRWTCRGGSTCGRLRPTRRRPHGDS